jgi:hypothetical protein
MFITHISELQETVGEKRSETWGRKNPRLGGGKIETGGMEKIRDLGTKKYETRERKDPILVWGLRVYKKSAQFL